MTTGQLTDFKALIKVLITSEWNELERSAFRGSIEKWLCHQLTKSKPIVGSESFLENHWSKSSAQTDQLG